MVPKRAGGGAGQEWDWAQVEGLRYLWRADQELAALRAGGALSALLDNATTLGVLEFEEGEGVSLEKLLSVYRQLQSSTGASARHLVTAHSRSTPASLKSHRQHTKAHFV